MRHLLVILVAGFCSTVLAQDECRVTTTLSAVHKEGSFITGLNAEQLRISLHGGSQPSHISLEERDDRDAALLLENRGRMYVAGQGPHSWHEMEIRAASDILKNLPPATSIRFTVFANAAESVKGKEASRALLTKTTLPSGRSALWQSLYDIASEMTSGGTMIAITDCVDNRSRVGSSEVRTRLLANHVRLVILLLKDDNPSTLEELNGPGDCEHLVTRVGGEVLPLRGDGSLTPVAVREMLHSYRLSLIVPKAEAKSKWKLTVATGNRAIDRNVVVEAPKTLPGCDAE